MLFACSNEKREADISGIELEVKIGRFDIDFWNLDTLDIPSELLRLEKKYPELLPIYLERIVEFGKVTDTITASTILSFYKDTAVINLYTDELAFADVSDIEAKLTDAFKRARYFSRQSNATILFARFGIEPKFGSGRKFHFAECGQLFGQRLFVVQKSDDLQLFTSEYVSRKIVSDYVTAFLVSEFPFVSQQRQLLDEMIYRGKIMYVQSLLLPNEPERLLMGYTPEQWAWAEKYEKEVWLTMLGKQHLFHTTRCWWCST